LWCGFLLGHPKTERICHCQHWIHVGLWCCVRLLLLCRASQGKLSTAMNVPRVYGPMQEQVGVALLYHPGPRVYVVCCLNIIIEVKYILGSLLPIVPFWKAMPPCMRDGRYGKANVLKPSSRVTLDDTYYSSMPCTRLGGCWRCWPISLDCRRRCRSSRLG
jgi:hypothetical protein